VLPLALWWLATRAGWVNIRLIVLPAAVLRTAAQALQDPLFYQGVLFSLGRDLAGFTAGAVAGLLLGVLMGVSRWADCALGPTFHTSRQISLFAWLPLLTRLVLPAAAPQIATSLTLGLVSAWVATIGSEFLLANWGHGLGNVIIEARAAFNVELIVFSMLVIGLVGALLNRVAARLEARALPWRVPAH